MGDNKASRPKRRWGVAGQRAGMLEPKDQGQTQQSAEILMVRDSSAGLQHPQRLRRAADMMTRA